MLRLAVATTQRLVTKGYTQQFIGPSGRTGTVRSQPPPVLCLQKCPAHTHIQRLAEYCEQTWASRVRKHRAHMSRPYAYRPRKTAREIEEHRLQRAL